MDRTRFEALAKLLATAGSRRAALGALLSVSLLGQDPEMLAKRGRGHGHGKGQDHHHADSGVQGEGRPGAKHKKRHQHKQTQRQRRKKRDRRDRRRGQKTGSESEVCCRDTKSCAPPEVGSDRSQCNFDEQAFSGQDLHGTSFRQIAGVGTAFDNADLHDADFTTACLRFATFRGADLANTKWDGACLFAVDLTGADLGVSPEALEAAVLCATTLPDGSRSDRDCDQSHIYDCCLPPPGGGGGGGEPCTSPADCPVQSCSTRTCPNGKCVYTPVDNGPDPTAKCAHCCRGRCCNAPATTCNSAGLCCAPNCAGKACGPDGCGTGGTCGTCPAHLACNDFQGRCVCDGRVCPNGCCAADSSCQPGNTDQACGTAGVACQACPADTTCRNGQCACTSSRACGSGLECVDGRCVCTAQSCSNGCCFGGVGSAGPCLPSCEPGFECRNGECVCTPQSCPGCCNPGGSCLPGNEPSHCGANGAVCQRCTDGQECRNGRCLCTPQSCPNGCCAADGTCQSGNTDEACGTGGMPCLFCASRAARTCQVPTHERCGWCDVGECKRLRGPHACCDPNSGTRGCMAGTTDQACGSASGVCVTCPAGEACVNGRCRCTSQAGCQFGQTCVDGACICSPDACAQINGCCAVDGTCQTGNTRQNCGAGGGPCATCRQDQICFNGICQS